MLLNAMVGVFVKYLHICAVTDIGITEAVTMSVKSAIHTVLDRISGVFWSVVCKETGATASN